MLSKIRERLFSPTTALIVVVALATFLLASYQLQAWPFGDHRTLRERYQFVRVSRTVVEPNLRAPGRVESSRRTIVRCALENMASTSGGAATSGGSSTMIWVVPEGTEVKKEDVMARLDGSMYEEMLRQQTIVVEQAKASHLQAQLDLEIARIALREYLEGTVQETVEQMEANLSLARSNVTQSEQRLEWSRKMNKKGYASVAQIKTDEQTFMTSQLALQQQETSYELFKRFTKPKNEKTLGAAITTAQTTLDSEQVKLNRQLERFETLKKQVDRCTIRAPHDGVVYYYTEAQRRPGQEADQIQEGMMVRQEQKLFFLPDLSEMEVQVVLNESVVSRVTPGLSATVEFEALPGLSLGGKLESISEIPSQTNPRGDDVRFFMGILKLDRSAEGLKPGMSAIVSLRLPRNEGVLAVPADSVVSAEGQYECLVPAGEDLVARAVKVGRTTPELIEITGGLTEGEEIALNPPVMGARRLRSLAGFESRPWPKGPLPKLDETPRAKAGRGGGGNGEWRKKGGGGGEWGQNPGGGNPTRRSRKRAADGEG
jgi:HlyD family secretion protein